MSIRPVKRLIKAKPTLEGAGVHLRRAFGFGNTSDFDPFLLLDDFRNDIPEDYLAGFPWHPHRGIETITYVLAGTVEHGDSMGNRGAIGRRRHPVDDGRPRDHPPGDAQGRPDRADARVPVVGQPAVVAQDDGAALSGSEGGRNPLITDDDGTRVRVVCGSFWGKTGPVDGIAADPIYLDVSVPPGKTKDAPGRDDAPRVRLRLRRVAGSSATPRPAGGADRGSGLGGHDASHRGGESLARAVRPRRRGHRAGRRRRDPLPAGLGQAAPGAGGLVRPDRDEHAGAAPAGVRGAPGGDVSEIG